MSSIPSSKINSFSSLSNHKFSDLAFVDVKPPDRAQPDSLVFVSSLDMVNTANKNGVKGLIVLEKIYDQVKEALSPALCIWTTKNINAAMVEVLPLFDKKPQAQGHIHPTASVHPNAQLGKDVTIDEYAVIKENAILKDHCWIGSHTVVENFAVVGKKSTLSPHVVIGSFCEIGDSCRIASHTTIGADGFGYFTDPANTHHKIAQIGIVVIEDRCELGTHCSVDRAALSETRIKAGSKFDNYCHIAHNVTIGENAIAAAGFMVSGSTIIGKNLIAAGGVQTAGHIHITDNVILAGRTGVTSSIEKPGVYGGFPQISHKENLKVLTSLPMLPQLRRQVARILKHLNLE